MSTLLKKLGVFTDTHGNFAALEAIYAYFTANGCDEIIHCGDMLTMGPRSKQCLDFFFSHPITLIRGNHDNDYLLNRVAQRGESHVKQEHKEFIFASLGDNYRSKIETVPLQVYRSFGNYTLAFMHYAPSKDPKFTFTPIVQQPTAEIFDDIFSPIAADAVFFGHKHEPCDLKGNRLYVDIGSVGCHNASIARGIIVNCYDDCFTYDRIAVPYDRASVYADMLTFNIPDAEQIFDYYFKEAENKK